MNQISPINNPDKDSTGLTLEALNERLVKKAVVLCEYVREKRTGCHSSDIMPPICYAGATLSQNIDSVLTCFGYTLASALFSESQYIKIFRDFEALSKTVDSEKYLIFDFLSKNNLTEKFNTFVNQQM